MRQVLNIRQPLASTCWVDRIPEKYRAEGPSVRLATLPDKRSTPQLLPSHLELGLEVYRNIGPRSNYGMLGLSANYQPECEEMRINIVQCVLQDVRIEGTLIGNYETVTLDMPDWAASGILSGAADSFASNPAIPNGEYTFTHMACGKSASSQRVFHYITLCLADLCSILVQQLPIDDHVLANTMNKWFDKL